MSWEGDELRALRCPFTGRTLKVCTVGSSYVAVSEGPEGGWVSTSFPDRTALVIFLAKHLPQGAPKIGEPLAKPTRICPFFGTEMTVRRSQSFNWSASSVDGKGRGYTTTSFRTEAHLDFFLATRAGVPPVFWDGSVSLRERKPPRPDYLAQESETRRKAVEDNVQEVMDHVGLATGILVPKPIVGPATHAGR